MQDALDLFEKKEISKIQILYTHYKNTLTFVPTLETVLPVSKPQEEKKSGMHADMIFEPDKETMLQNMIPMVTKSILYSRYLESKTSEQASRRMAMEVRVQLTMQKSCRIILNLHITVYVKELSRKKSLKLSVVQMHFHKGG